MCKDLVLKQFPGISNVKLHIVATRFGSRKIPPRKHSVTPPVPGVSDLSQLFRQALKTVKVWTLGP